MHQSQCVLAGSWPCGCTVIGRADRWIRHTTIGCVGMLALIAGTVSYLHMHLLVELHRQPGWRPNPLSVDGMIVAASTTLLADSRAGARGGFLPWALLVAGSMASLAANVAVAEPTVTGRVIAAWPSFALIASYELLMRQARRAAAETAEPGRRSPRSAGPAAALPAPVSLHRRLSPLQLVAGRLAWIRGSMLGSGLRKTGPRMARCPRAGI